MDPSTDMQEHEPSASPDDVNAFTGSIQDAVSQVLTTVRNPEAILQGNSDMTVDKERSDYVRTPAFDEADEVLQNTGRVILCGPPGCGKTTLANALLRRSREQGCRPYKLQRMEQWGSHIGRDESSVVMLDGILGEVRVDSEQYDCWKKNLDTVLLLIKKGVCRLVLTVYPHILRELQQLEDSWNSPIRDDSAVVRLTDALAEPVKEELLNVHLNRLHLETDQQREIVNKVLQNDASGPVFPWCCDQMSSEDPSSIFLAPAEAHAKLLKDLVLHKAHGSAFVAVLTLTMKGVVHFLHHPSRAAPHLQELGFKPHTDDKLARYADVLRGSILSEEGDNFFSRVHYEAAGLALGRSFRLPALLKVCDIRFLVQYVHFIFVQQVVSDGQFSNFCVTVGPVANSPINPNCCAEDCQSLVERIYMEIIQGNLQHICQHPCLQCLEFLLELDNYCQRDSKRLKTLFNAVEPEHKLPLIYWSACHPSHNMTLWCLSKITAFKQLSAHVLMACSLFDNILQRPQCRVQPFLQTTLIPDQFKHPESVMDFPLLGRDQCLREEIQKEVKFITETGSAHGRLLYLCDASLPIPSDIVTVRVTHDKLQLQVKDRRSWYLVFRLLADREVNETDQDGNSLLHIALSSAATTAVRLALKAGAVITQRNKQGLTPYQLAHKTQSSVLKNRKVTTIDETFRRLPDLDKADLQFLLLQDLSVTDKDSDGSTGLLVACREGRGDIANLFIELGADVSVDDAVPCMYFFERSLEVHECCTPLHYACKNGMVQTVGLLIDHGAGVNTTTRNGDTALHLACLYSSPAASADMAHLLVLAGADVDAKNKDGNSSLLYAATKGYSDTVEVLICHGADVNTRNKKGHTPVLQAVKIGHMNTVGLLIRHGANVNTQDEHENSLLLCAVRNGHTDLAEVLIRHSADVSMPDETGITPLLCAVRNSRSALAESLMQNGANVNAQDEHGDSPLLYAARNGHFDIAEALISHGADVNTRDRWRDTPLLATVKNGHLNLAQLLLSHDAEVNAQDDEGITPLLCAAKNGCSETVQLLIHHEANINMPDNHGNTPVLCASAEGHSDAVKVLIQRGADVSSRNENSDTALLCAIRNDHTDTIEVLRHLVAEVSKQDASDNPQPL